MSKYVRICYVNWRGETTHRTIIPGKMYFDHNEWHPEDQWLLDAFDVDKKVARTFAMKDILEWTPIK